MTAGQNSVRALMVYALVLPLALVLGYFLATSGVGSYIDVTSWAPLLLVLGVLCLPLLFQLHHPLLVLSLNMGVTLLFLPGSPPIWFLMTALSLTLSIVQRTIDREMHFVRAPSIVWPLLFIAAVVYLTGRFTGGFGARVFGSGQYGGKRYWLIFGAIAAFFAITARPIRRDQAKFYVALFLLGSLADVMSNVIPFLPKEFYWLATIFPVSMNDLGSQGTQGVTGGIARYLGLTGATFGLFVYLLARYGVRGMLSASKFGRFLLLMAVLMLSMLGGFRLSIVTLGLTFLLVFYFEGLLWTRYAALLLGLIVMAGVALIPLANKLPLSIQRSLTIFPLNLDPVARYEAMGSSEWRLEMWSIVLPQVPRYLLTPKGLGMDGFDIELTSDLINRGLAKSQDIAILAGDYHNGPLSILIPFGIWGFAGWLWFLVASIRALWLNYRYGRESLRKANTALLAYFLARLFVFFVIFGGFFSELIVFVGLVSFSLALNGGICTAEAPEEEKLESDAIETDPVPALMRST
jgi:hypothetical protein